MTGFHPAEQGAYDHLCAVYTIINARRWLDGRTGDADSVFDRANLRLFRQLVAEALEEMSGLDLVTRGPDAGQVARLIGTAGLTATGAPDPATLDRHMSRENASAIIHFTYDYEANRPDHYSLLIRQHGREALFDSYQFCLEVRTGWHLRFSEETGLPQGAVIRSCWLIGG